jgi:hypothetical protein
LLKAILCPHPQRSCSAVQASLVIQQLVSQWGSLRRFLPASFPGKYDVDQFKLFVSSSLVSLGFMAICAGLLLVAQCWGAMRLRFELKINQEINEELQAVNGADLPPDLAEAITQQRAQGRLQTVWKERWTRGSPVSRRLIIAGCVLLAVLVAGAIAAAVFALYFSQYCPSISEFHDSKIYSPVLQGRPETPVFVQV